MKEDLTNESSSNDSRGRVIKMIPTYAVHRERHSQHSLQELNRNLELLIAKLEISQAESKRISVPSQKGTEFLRENEVVSCQAKGSYTEIRLESGLVLTDSKGLRYYDRMLNPSYFLRTNRAWIVNLRKVVRFYNSTNELETSDGIIVPVSRDLVPEVKQRVSRAFQS